MKKIYLLSLISFLCCLSIASFAASSVSTIYSTGAALSYITGNSTAAVRTDGNIMSTTGAQYGYAVFDLTGIPAGAIIEGCTVGYNVAVFGGAGVPSACNLYGYAGDLSTVTVPATLYADMTSGSLLFSGSFGPGAGNQTLVPAPIIAFLQANIGSKVSVCWTGGGTRTYTITGETGTATIGGVHAPYLQINYCAKPTGVTATANPNPVCTGTNLTLGGTATIPGLASYLWTGPGGYTGAGLPTTTVATLASAGIYTLTAVNMCTTTTYSVTAATTTVSVNPSPAAITGSNAVCFPGTTPLSDATPGGTWSPAASTMATVGSTTGIVSAVAVGATTISYILPPVAPAVTGCFAVIPMAVNAPPASITGPGTKLCQGQTMSLTETVGGGVWSSSSTLLATVVPPGTVSAVAGGPVTINYTIAGCAPKSYPMTINDTPSAIIAPAGMCTGNSITLSDAAGGGTWGESGGLAGFFPPFTSGVLIAGMTTGTDIISYTFPGTLCYTTVSMTISAAPATPTGPTPLQVCAGQTIALSDATPAGSWTTANTLQASVDAFGVVTGISGGNPKISYSTGVGCYASITVKILAAPSAIIGPASLCQNDSVFLSDATSGGVWSSANTTMAKLGSTSGFVKALTSGPYNVTYTNPASGCYSTLNITFNPSPSAVISGGPTTFCTGGSVTLTVPPAGVGGSYQWYDGGVPIGPPMGTTPTYSTNTTQTVTIRVINGIACTTYSAPVLVISGISPTLNASGPVHFCLGSNVVFTANTGATVGSITYQWQKNGGNIPSATAVNYVATTAGIYNCVVSVSGSSGTCTVPTSADTVTTSTPPTPAIAYSGHTLSTGKTYTSYQWFLNTLGITGAVSATYVPVQTGSYRVLVYDNTGCGGYSTAIQINSISAGLEQVNKPEVKIYPNPASSVIHIESTVSVRAVITGIEGKTLLEEANAKDINISNLASGLYIIMLFDGNGERLMVQKLIKE